MKFFFPDSQDQIAPGFDFVSEEHAPHRIRQRDDLYAHEVLSQAPFDGILVSKAIVDGKPNAAGKYTMAQRNPSPSQVPRVQQQWGAMRARSVRT